ncbi:MAG: putative secreted protein [Candidatus Phytoplasma asteris]|uniref:Mg-dependent DNase n=1 Tax='Chrysanthemum coronarium' phytoplasma TaxID=1520703 RepID=A0ABQ0J3Q1_9MOLU|nr:hypothetical protein ['Chrysanthemum coronarium' phytoplasma]TKA87688.1 MAG: putative secreted protein [Periwinkle leaf yellowing phytoplasma]WEX20051.1 MAG: putative secreted protein [Candidatus Phytoplasma asteris]GAK74241.1 Mg-dependent DNase ['Chrysanthemum coronarium' phytoplasma]
MRNVNNNKKNKKVCGFPKVLVILGAALVATVFIVGMIISTRALNTDYMFKTKPLGTKVGKANPSLLGYLYSKFTDDNDDKKLVDLETKHLVTDTNVTDTKQIKQEVGLVAKYCNDDLNNKALFKDYNLVHVGYKLVLLTTDRYNAGKNPDPSVDTQASNYDSATNGDFNEVKPGDVVLVDTVTEEGETNKDFYVVVKKDGKDVQESVFRVRIEYDGTPTLKHQKDNNGKLLYKAVDIHGNEVKDSNGNVKQFTFDSDNNTTEGQNRTLLKSLTLKPVTTGTGNNETNKKTVQNLQDTFTKGKMFGVMK